ncbi:unnamed protein product [Schistosoma curassoni]|uniref:Uncharacterized protein n=1 Tax=Schistosoma curassoni TaxID=6186 RepID=A0A183KCX1_9TREM|nr:unnamed protein product [Schistosoma curassoni]
MPTAATDWAAAKLAIVAIKLCASIGEDPDRLLDPKFNGRPKAPGGAPCEAAAAAAIAAAIAAAAAVLCFSSKFLSLIMADSAAGDIIGGNGG